MMWWLIGFASAAALFVATKHYCHERRVDQRLKARTGLSRADFVERFSREGIATDVSLAVYDCFARDSDGVCPEDDLEYVYGLDGELFMDTLHVLRRELGIAGGTLRAAWKEFGNVSTVRDLVEMVALAHRQQDSQRSLGTS